MKFDYPHTCTHTHMAHTHMAHTHGAQSVIHTEKYLQVELPKAFGMRCKLNNSIRSYLNSHLAGYPLDAVGSCRPSPFLSVCCGVYELCLKSAP